MVLIALYTNTISVHWLYNWCKGFTQLIQNRLIKMCTSYICSVYFIITCIAKPLVSCLCYCMATGRSCTWSPHLQSAWWRLSLHWALIFIWRIRDEVTQHKTPTNARQQQGITTALLVDLRRTVPWSLAGLVAVWAPTLDREAASWLQSRGCCVLFPTQNWTRQTFSEAVSRD